MSSGLWLAVNDRSLNDGDADWTTIQIKQIWHVDNRLLLLLLCCETVSDAALTKSDLKLLDFAVNRFLMKTFRSNNPEIIAECHRYF